MSLRNLGIFVYQIIHLSFKITETMRQCGVFLSFCIFSLLLGQSCSVTDTLLQGQSLNDGQELVSAFRIFKLGFFSPGKSGKWYLGIWYNNDYLSVKTACGADLRDTVVWTANGNDPSPSRYGSLIIDSLGKLKISRGAMKSVELSSTETTSNTTLKLLDSGNLQLQEMNPDGSVKRILWQSFDYPTDTLLPGMKLGFDIRTGKKWELKSSLSSDLPAPGSFTFGMDPNITNRLIISWRGNIYWVSGLWFRGFFTLRKTLNLRYFNFSFVSTGSETYFSYSADQSEYDAISFPRIMIDKDGILRIIDLDGEQDHVDWFPLASRVQGLYDSYDYSQSDRCVRLRRKQQYDSLSEDISLGCYDQELPDCLGSSALSNVFTSTEASLSSNGFALNETNGRLNSRDCLRICVLNCSCLAYASTNADGTGCEIWSIDPINKTSSSHTRTIHIRASRTDLTTAYTGVAKGKKLAVWLAVGASVVLIVLAFCMFFYLVLRKYKTKVIAMFGQLFNFLRGNLIPRLVVVFFSVMHFIRRKLHAPTANLIMDQEMLLRELGIDRRHKHRRTVRKNNELLIFSFENIASATVYFSDANKLGEGGFGPVYMGTLEDGQEVAIKRLSMGSGQGLVEFKNEAMLIAKLQHTNLVQLLGCCVDKGEKMLIYEYMPNKSLDYFLFDPSRRNILDWTMRFSIMEGTIQGLLYLHKYSRLRVIHRDIKASNILLDEEMNPKISDFGMARIFGAQESKAVTSRVAGTFGYMPPEYFREGLFSTKSDVYSLGVLMLEIVSGRKNRSLLDTEEPINLITHAWNLWREKRVSELIDPSLGDSSPLENLNPQVLRCVQVALLCVQENPEDRPSMLDVVSMIYGEANALPPPREPAFYDTFRRNSPETETELPASEILSESSFTVTEMEAR